MISILKKYSFLLLLFAIVSCDSDAKKTVPDVSGINVDFKTIRFEKEMLNSSVTELTDKYPVFSDIFFNHVIPVKREQNYEEVYTNIKSAPELKYLVDTIETLYPDFSEMEAQFRKAFQFMKHYTPEIDVPDLYTFVSGFAHQQFLFEEGENQNAMGIGLDMFMEDFNYGAIAPENPAFSDYLTRTFNNDHMVRKTINALLDDYIPNSQQQRMIDMMIYNGKKLYLMDLILPLTPDSVIMEYSEQQWEWAEDNEIEMWAYFLKENLFYETNSQKINKYINPSPHSPGMPPSAPGRTANFIGWKIIEAYMNRFPETTIDQLIHMDDAQALMQKSRYKPKK